MLEAKCEDCDFETCCQVDLESGSFIMRNFIFSETFMPSGDTYNAMSCFVSKLYSHIFKTSHYSITVKYTCQATGKICFYKIDNNFFKHYSRVEFSEIIVDFFLKVLGKSELIRRELHVIDSLIQTEGDAELLEQFREQELSNRQIIHRLYEINCERARASDYPGRSRENATDNTEDNSEANQTGQSHLELDESKLETTGKSVSIDDVLAKIDEALEED